MNWNDLASTGTNAGWLATSPVRHAPVLCEITESRPPAPRRSWRDRLAGWAYRLLAGHEPYDDYR